MPTSTSQYHLVRATPPEIRNYTIDGFAVDIGGASGEENGQPRFHFAMPDSTQLIFLLCDAANEGYDELLAPEAVQDIIQAAAAGSPVAECVKQLNSRLCRRPSKLGISLVFGRLDLSTDILRCTQAGGPFFMLLREGDTALQLAVGGPAVGTCEGTKYGYNTVALRKGDAVLIYSAGHRQAFNGDGQEGFPREGVDPPLRDYLARSWPRIAASISPASEYSVLLLRRN